MTNGEKIKEIFPDIEFTDMAFTVHAVAEATSNGVKGHISYDFWKSWWNAEYKEPTIQERQAESDKFDAIFQAGYEHGYAQAKYDYEQESTTKNDLVPRNVVERIIKSTRTKEQMLSVLNSLPPQESTSKNDSVVDWDELKRKIFMEVDGGTDDKWLRYADVCDNISNSIDEFKAELPSVTPQEPRKGHWIPLGYEDEWWGEVCTCSECGSSMFRNNYCPNCGADMREVEK